MKIWLVYATVGGGHRSASLAIAQEFERRYQGRVETVLINASEGAPTWVRKVFEGGYAWLINYAPQLWKILYQISKLKLVMRVEIFLFTLATKKYFIRQYKISPPDKIISLYFLVGPTLTRLSQLQESVPIVTVVTDPFTAHPIWFYIQESWYIVFSRDVKEVAVQAGVAPRQVEVVPTVINNKFLEDPNEYDIRAFKTMHGLAPHKPVVLIIGGADGLPNGDKLLEYCLQAHFSIEVDYVVVCGRNKRLRERAEQVRALRPGSVVVLSFIDYVHELIAASEVVITKGGPGIVLETLALKKPLIITQYIWEQEKGNVEFVLKHGLGIYETDLTQVPARLEAFLFDQDVRQQLRKNFEQVKIQNGTALVADYVYARL